MTSNFTGLSDNIARQVYDPGPRGRGRLGRAQKTCRADRGQNLMTTRPTMSERGIVPKNRLSSESERLSPMTKTGRAGPSAARCRS